MGDERGFTLEYHGSIGHRLKICHNYLESVRANLAVEYPKSSKKELRQLEAALNQIRNVQTALHGRLLGEHPEKPDSELLPKYLGRLPDTSN